VNWGGQMGFDMPRDELEELHIVQCPCCAREVDVPPRAEDVMCECGELIFIQDDRS